MQKLKDQKKLTWNCIALYFECNTNSPVVHTFYPIPHVHLTFQTRLKEIT